MLARLAERIKAMNWYYSNGDNTVGPLSEATLKELHACGVLHDDSKVRQDGADEWMTFCEAFRENVGKESATEVEIEADLIKFQCPHCNAKISAEAEFEGQSASCPACGASMTVPKGGGVSTKPMPASEKPQPPPMPTSSPPPLSSQSESAGAPAAPNTARTQAYSPARSVQAPSARPPAGKWTRKQTLITAVTAAFLLIVISSRFGGSKGGTESNRGSGTPANAASNSKDPDSSVGAGAKDLASCCTSGDLAGVSELVNDGNINGGEGQTPPLHIAAQAGHADIVEFLIKHGADINKSDGYGMYPIHRAASGGKLDVIKILLAAGAKADQKSGARYNDKQHMELAAEVRGFSASDRFLPIHSAAEGNQPDVVKFFINAGIPANAKDGSGSNVLDYAVHNTGWSDERAILIRMLDTDGSFEHASKECISTDGFYFSEVTMRDNSSPTQVYIRFMPEVRKLDTTLNKTFLKRRMIVSLGSHGGTDPGDVLKWLTPKNKAAIEQGSLLEGDYRVMGKMGVFGGFLKFEGYFSNLRAQRENGELKVSIQSQQESFFPGNGEPRMPTASYRFIRCM